MTEIEALKQLHQNLLEMPNKRLCYMRYLSDDNETYCTAAATLPKETLDNARTDQFSGFAVWSALVAVLPMELHARLCAMNNALGPDETEEQRYTRILHWVEGQLEIVPA